MTDQDDWKDKKIEKLEAETERLKGEVRQRDWWAETIFAVVFILGSLFFAGRPEKASEKYDETSNYVLCLQHPSDFRPHKCSDFK